MADTPEAGSGPNPRRSPDRQRVRERSVIFYLAILFSAAFVLLLLTLIMERRQNAESLGEMNQSLTGLRESVSAMQSAQALYEGSAELAARVAELEEQTAALKAEKAALERENAALKEAADTLQAVGEGTKAAMDWFWQLDEAYVRGRTGLCRNIIGFLEDASGGTPLRDYLPAESATGNGRFSPRDRFQEIKDAVG